MKDSKITNSTKKLRGFRAGDSTQIIKYYLDNKINTVGKTNRQELLNDIVSSKKGIFILKRKYIRDVIQIHQNLGLLDLYVPHTEEYTLPKEDFLQIAKLEMPDIYTTIGDFDSIPEIVILLREPTSRELSSLSLLHFRRYYWSLIFHGEIHKLHLKWEQENKFSDHALNLFIENIGRDVFEEVRYVLSHENLLFDKDNDREVVYEFIAYFLQFYNFAPQSLTKIFPKIPNYGEIYKKITELEFDVEKLLIESRPNNAITVEELLINREYRLQDPQPDLPIFDTRYHLDKIYDSPQFKSFFGADKIKFREQYNHLIEGIVDNVIGHNGIIAHTNFKRIYTLAYRKKISMTLVSLLHLNSICKKYLKPLYKPCSITEKWALKMANKDILTKEKYREAVKRNTQQLLDGFIKEKEHIETKKPNIFLSALVFPFIFIWFIVKFIPSRLLLSVAKSFQLTSIFAQKIVNKHIQKKFANHLRLAHYFEKRGNMAIAFIEYKRAMDLIRNSIAFNEEAKNIDIFQQLKEKAQKCSEHIKNEFAKEYKYNEQETQDFKKLFDYLLRISPLKNIHRRLLQDIQKSYIDARKQYFKISFGRWLFSLGKKSFRINLTSIPLLKKIRALRSIEKRIYKLQIRKYELNILKKLVTKAFENEENYIREYYRPLLEKAFCDAGIKPQTINVDGKEILSQRESVAQYKMQEEILDLFVNKGYVHMMDLRDIISRNQLKMGDLRNPVEFVLGDQLLRLDKKVHEVMMGVHRRGEIYMRLIHRFSSLLFGFGIGRLLAKYIIVPFGLSFVLFGLLTHGAEKFVKSSDEVTHIKQLQHDYKELEEKQKVAENELGEATDNITAIEHELNEEQQESARAKILKKKEELEQKQKLAADNFEQIKNSMKLVTENKHEIEEKITHRAETVVVKPIQVLLIKVGQQQNHRVAKISWISIGGLLVLFFFYTSIGWSLLKSFFNGIIKLLRILFIKIPKSFWLLGPIQFVYKLKLWRFLNIFILRPAVYSLPVTIPIIFFTHITNYVSYKLVILLGIALTNLIINTSLGRNIFDYLEERIVHFIYEFNRTVFIGLFDITVEMFKKSIQGIERLLYTVDDFFRFRQGENIISQILKAVFGKIWNMINYIFRFTIILVAEPQINPIKHFPIVTISHKIILGFSIPLTKSMNGVIEDLSFGSSVLFWVGTSLLFFFIQFGLPGICGFIAWELKENWKLYKYSSSKSVKPVVVGGHGETIARFLREGFHSGTIPKLYRKMRSNKYETPKVGEMGKIEYEQHHICHDLEKFMNRSFCQQFKNNPKIQEMGLKVSVGHPSIYNQSIEIPVHLKLKDQETSFKICYSLHYNLLSSSVEGDISHLDPNLQDYIHAMLMVLWKESAVEIIPKQLNYYIEKHLRLEKQWCVRYGLDEDHLMLQIYADNSLIPVGELSYNLSYEQIKPRLVKAFSSQHKSLGLVNREELVIKYLDVKWEIYDTFVMDYIDGKSDCAKNILPTFIRNS